MYLFYIVDAITTNDGSRFAVPESPVLKTKKFKCGFPIHSGDHLKDVCSQIELSKEYRDGVVSGISRA